jgi:hypothetical protein
MAVVRRFSLTMKRAAWWVGLTRARMAARWGIDFPHSRNFKKKLRKRQ